MASEVEKVRKKAEIIEKVANKFPGYNKVFENVSEKLNVSYGKDKDNILDIYYPKDKKERKDIVILYIHGGGWISFDKDFYKRTLLYLASNGYIVFNINYHLAPEYKINTMEKDILEAIKYAIKKSKKKKIFIMGDSAGAHLASLVTNKLVIDCYKDNLKDYIVGNGLFYGVYDLKNIEKTKFHDIDTYIKSITKSDRERELYSPITYLSNKIPKVFISSGEIDKLYLESKKYYKLLEKHNIKVEKLFFKKALISGRHSFLNYYNSKACKKSLEKLLEFLNSI